MSERDTATSVPGSLTPEERARQAVKVATNVFLATEDSDVAVIAAAIREAVAEETRACLAIAAEGFDESDYSLQGVIIERIRARI